MRSIKDVNKKYFITNKNDSVIFKDIDRVYYCGVLNLRDIFRREYPSHRYNSDSDLKYFYFGEREFKKIKDYHINNGLETIDYGWLVGSFDIKDFRYY